MNKLFRIFARIFTCVVISGALTWVAPVTAQEGGNLTVVIDEIDTNEYDADSQTMAVYVTVRHVKGRPAAGLTPDNFTLSVSGGPLFVPEYAELVDDGPVSIGIVLELYNSMRGKPLDDAKSAISTLCRDDKKDVDRCALFGVRENVDPDNRDIDPDFEKNYTHDGGDVANFVQGLQVVNGVGTPLYDTLIRAINFTAEGTSESTVSGEPPGRRALVVITDGGDRGSMYSDQDVINAAQRLRVPVFAIGYTGGNKKHHEDLKRIAIDTLGDYKEAPQSEDFAKFLTDIRDQMSHRYRLTVKREIAKGRQIMEVQVDVSGLFGTDSQKFDIEVGSALVPTLAPSATPGENDPTPTPISETDTVTPTVEETTGDESADLTLMLIIGGGVLLLIMMIVLVMVLIRRKKQAANPEQVWSADDYEAGSMSYPDLSGAPNGQTLSAAPGTGTKTVSADSWQSPGTQPTEFPQPTGTIPGISQPPPPPPVGYGPVQNVPSPQGGGTMILERKPKMAHYAMLIDQKSRAKHDIDAPAINIGRADTNNIRLDGVKVSRQHATIKLEGDVFRLYDLGSANGTFVNDVQVRAPVVLKDGDHVRFGDQALIFKPIS